MRRLLIRPGAIGDCILSFPALAYLRSEYTEVWISAPVVPLVDFADVVRPLPSTGIDLLGVGDLEPPDQLIQRLRSFDSIVSWCGANRPEFREAMSKINPRCTFLAALPPPEQTRHAIDFFSAQVEAPLGLQPRIHVESRNQKRGVVIHPFSGSKKKNWPLERYRELAEHLPAPVEWTAGPEEQLADAVRFTGLRELAKWITRARLYIGNDSGITHLAAATGVPTLALFGPASSPSWAPRGEHVNVLRASNLDALSVETVLAGASRLLRLP